MVHRPRRSRDRRAEPARLRDRLVLVVLGTQRTEDPSHQVFPAWSGRLRRSGRFRATEERIWNLIRRQTAGYPPKLAARIRRDVARRRQGRELRNRDICHWGWRASVVVPAIAVGLSIIQSGACAQTGAARHQRDRAVAAATLPRCAPSDHGVTTAG